MSSLFSHTSERRALKETKKIEPSLAKSFFVIYLFIIPRLRRRIDWPGPLGYCLRHLV